MFITNLQVMVDSCIYSNKVCKFYLCVVVFWSVNAQCVPCSAFLVMCVFTLILLQCCSSVGYFYLGYS